MTKHLKIDDSTHGDLLSIGKKGESFDAIIKRLIKVYNQKVAS